MKSKIIFLVAAILCVGSGIAWLAGQDVPAAKPVASGGRQVLYYTCAMHPWVRENKPGPCPVCGMNLTPVYANGDGAAQTTNSATDSGEVTLEPDSISTIHVQTVAVARRPVRHTLHLSGEIVDNSRNAAWFAFTVYERDLQWLKIGQTLDVSVAGVPDKTFKAQIKLRGARPFADRDFDMMTSSTTVRAEISDPPVEPGDFGKNMLFDGLHAEAHLVAETEPVRTIPRSAIISRGEGAMVYVDKGDGHYASRSVQLGRIGNDDAEVLAGLEEGEKVVTNGNVLIDSEAQLTKGE